MKDIIQLKSFGHSNSPSTRQRVWKTRGPFSITAKRQEPVAVISLLVEPEYAPLPLVESVSEEVTIPVEAWIIPGFPSEDLRLSLGFGEELPPEAFPDELLIPPAPEPTEETPLELPVEEPESPRDRKRRKRLEAFDLKAEDTPADIQ